LAAAEIVGKFDGAPNSGDPATECFPPAFRTASDADDPNAMLVEPLGRDIRREGRERAVARRRWRRGAPRPGLVRRLQEEGAGLQ